MHTLIDFWIIICLAGDWLGRCEGMRQSLWNETTTEVMVSNSSDRLLVQPNTSTEKFMESELINENSFLDMYSFFNSFFDFDDSLDFPTDDSNAYHHFEETVLGNSSRLGNSPRPNENQMKDDLFDKSSARWRQRQPFWTELVFKGRCSRSFPPIDFQIVNTTQLITKLGRLISTDYNEISISSYSCREVLRINVSLDTTTFKKSENFLNTNIHKFVLRLLGRNFKFIGFTSPKSTIFEKKQSLTLERVTFPPVLAYGFSLLSIIFLCISSILYFCHNRIISKKRNKRKLLLLSAFDNNDELKPSAQSLTFPNVYKTFPQEGTVDAFDEGSSLALDFDMSSEFDDDEPYKSQEKISSSQPALDQTFHDRGQGNETSTRASISSECFEQPGDSTHSEYFRGRHYYYENLKCDLVNNYDEVTFDSTPNEEERDESQNTPLQNSTESLGITRVEYVDGDDANFRFETDL